MLRIRQTADLDLIKELDREIFVKDKVLEDDDLEQSVWWVAYVNGQPAGYAGLRLYGNKLGYLTRAGLLKTARGGGIQKKMIRIRLRYAKKHDVARVYTYCTSTNHASMRSLFACGMKPYFTEVNNPRGTFIFFENIPKEKGHTPV